MKLSLVIPAYNEETRLGAMLESYGNYFLNPHAPETEFIVVVNGSRDRTEEVAREYARRYPRLRVLVDPRPIGKGGAVMMGFAEARGEMVGFVDADGSTPPEAFNDLVDHLDAADAIIASRWLPGAQVSPRQPLQRRIASRIFNALVRLLFVLRISDTQCSAKLMKAEALKVVLPRLGLTRWAFDVDLLFQLRRAGFRITERPTVWRDVGGSKLQIPRVSLEMFIAICRLRMLYSPFRWIVDIYDRTIGIRIHLAP